MSKSEEMHIGQAHNSIALGTLIKGEVTTENDFRIDGNIEGNIHSHGRVIIGDKGKLVGSIEAADVDVMGYVKGNVIARGTLSLKSTGRIEGDITTSALIIEQNAEFNGSCTMTTETSAPTAAPKAGGEKK